MTKKTQITKTEKDKLYEEITNHCDWLHIARYLKNEAKSSLKYFHEHKLSNIKRNLKEFSDYLIFLNYENCQKIENFTEWKETKRILNNSLSYFYDYEDAPKSNLSLIQKKNRNKFLWNNNTHAKYQMMPNIDYWWILQRFTHKNRYHALQFMKEKIKN